MPSFKDQMKVHDAARKATNTLEVASREAISKAFESWAFGDLNPRTVRYDLEATIRSAYRSSASVAREVSRKNSEVPGWEPDEVFNTEYLQDLLGDVRRNLRDFKSGDLTKAQAVSRISHSAGVAAQRGYTDQIISAYSELEELGFTTEKYWVANFDNNNPCFACRRLHGTSVGLHESFREESGEPGVYRDLQGPPRHPRCKCKLYILTNSLENSFEVPNFESQPEAPNMMTSEEVRGMSFGVFGAIFSALVATLRFIRGLL